MKYRYLIALIAPAACHHAPQLRISPGTPKPASPISIAADSLVTVILNRGIGGWGNGSDYTFTFDLTAGVARYRGRTRAIFRGDYDAPIPASSVAALRSTLARPGVLRVSDGFCYDATTAQIRLVFANKSHVEATASCGAPFENNSLADSLDSFGAHLRWMPSPR